MKIAVLTSHWFSVPCILQLRERGLLAAIGIPETIHEGTLRLRAFAQQTGISVNVVPKSSLMEALESWLSAARADAVFVMGFPYRVPEALLDFPRLGFINFHFGLLPEYQGPDPVFWEIRDGVNEGAITVHRLDGGLDSGPILFRQTVPILPGDTYGIHMMALAQTAPSVMQTAIETLASNPKFEAQDATRATYRKKPGPHDLSIAWSSMSAVRIEHLVRACNPQGGGAFTIFRAQILRIHQVRVLGPCGGQNKAGEIIEVQAAKGAVIATTDGLSVLLEVLSTEAGIFDAIEFVRVYQPQTGEQFSS